MNVYHYQCHIKVLVLRAPHSTPLYVTSRCVVQIQRENRGSQTNYTFLCLVIITRLISASAKCHHPTG